MANLAIRGHETRGKEVIELLEMLGTCNPEGYVGSGDWYYCIADNEIIRVYYWNNFTVFTLEEFLEKYPFKVGDFVSIPEYESEVRICKMRWDPTCQNVEYLVYRNDEEVWYSAQELKECNADFLTNKEEKKSLLTSLIEHFRTTPKEEIEKEWNEHKELDEIGPTVEEYIDFVEKFKKQPKYPKTYEECCSVLGTTYDYPDIQMVSIEECNLYSSFIQLIRCRNAYWKIAGKEMGLGKPWKPDWDWREYKFCIGTIYDKIEKFHVGPQNYILTFPTEEMRDAFWENFYDLIEVCKELL